MKTLKIALALTMAGGMAAAHADYTFGDVSINQLNWSQSTLDKTQHSAWGAKRNFQYLEAEGGAGRSWGDVYGFFDLENWNRHDPQMASGDQRYTFKVVARFNLTEVAGLPIKLYTHVYDTRDSDTDPYPGNQFFDQNRVLGLSTDLNIGKVWVHPFLGRHQEMKAGVGAHMNGYMAGYVAGYNFDLFGQSFALTQWHETEFARSDYFVDVAQPGAVVQKRTGQNGAVSLWWNVNKQLTTGVQYRYAVNKLGTAGNEYAWIYTAKYNF